MPDHTTSARAVFLSYAREDAEPVRRIADALRAFGVEVWFDQNELRGGDAWDTKIRTQIRTCTLCIPVISATTQARGEGYFRREWKFAVERTHDMAAGVPFLLPIVIDDTPESEALVPEEFMRVQWTRLPKGVPTPQFVEQVKKQLEGKAQPAVRPRSVAGLGEAGPGSPTPAAKRGIPGWTWGALTAVAVGVAAALGVFRKADPPAVPTAVPVAEAKPVTPAAPSPRISDKSIAVLPFTNMSEEKDSAFFTDGIHEDILTNLALIRELRVVSRTSVMAYRKPEKSMRQIAQELGVTYILEGSVRRVGNKVRVTGQLIHAASDEHVWAASYDRDLTDIFTIQAELSQQIAGALKAALSPEEKVMLARKPTENPAAYDLFLRARDIRNREGNTFDSFKRRNKLLESAVGLDPSFAQAWAELGASYAYAVFLNYDGMDEFLARAKAAIDRAVQLAPDDFDVISNLGTYYYYGFRDYARATEQYERLARLQPNSPVVFNSLALIQRRQGRWAQALGNHRRAAELDPSNLSYQRNLASTLLAGNRYDEARVVKQRIATLLPDRLVESLAVAGISFAATGSTREGDDFFAQLTPAQRDSPEGLALRLGWARTRGDLAEAIRLAGLQAGEDGAGAPQWLHDFEAALDLFVQGDKAAAIARLGTAPAELRQRLAKEPANSRNWAYMAAMEMILGNKSESLRCIERSAELLPESRDALDGVSVAGYRTYCYAWMGDKEKALVEMRRLLRTPFGLNVHELRASHFEFAADPRFQALLNDPANNAPLF